MAYKKLIKVSNVCQLLDKRDYPATQTMTGITFTNNGDGTITVEGTSTTNTNYNLTAIGKFPIKANHKYLVLDSTDSTGRTKYSTWLRANTGFVVCDSADKPIGSLTYDDFKCTVYVRVANGNTVSNLTFKPQLFDLTEMYGAGNEPTTVEQFRQDYPNELYEYSQHCWLTSYKQVITTGEGNYLTSYQKNLTCKTKNLFDIPLIQGYPSDTTMTNTALRTFTVGTYIAGIARNNYYNPNGISDFAVDKNKIKITVKSNGYGIAIPLLLTVGNTYTVSCKADNDYYPFIGITFYKEDGTLISYTKFPEVIGTNLVTSFTVPENAYYTLILFYGRANNEYTFSNIQLELGSTATDYVPYGHL